jgi:hypothetical protein
MQNFGQIFSCDYYITYMQKLIQNNEQILAFNGKM